MKNNSKINVHTFKSVNFAERACEILYEKFREVLHSKGEAFIALSGGTTPIPILSLLKERKLNWNKINFFLVDERDVPIEDKNSNYGSLKACFFNYIDANCYPIIKGDIINLEKASLNYEKLIINTLKKNANNIPEFDIILLGMGNDGHTASLFPQTKGLEINDRLVIQNFVPQINSKRITFTYPLIMNASEIIILISGEEKRNLLESILHKKDREYPIAPILFSKVKTTTIMTKDEN